MTTLCNIMEKTAQDFIQKFHALEGVTIGERKRNFFNLLTESAPLKENAEIADAISTNLKPATFLEQLFKLEVLIFFRRATELLEILKEGNDIFISKIIKQKWFILEIFKEVGSEELVNEYLPSMSFHVRMKILRNLSKHLTPEQFDKIFDAVAARYGSFISNQFFLGCSSDKIKKLLEEKQIKLNQSHLKILHKQDPKLVEFFFTKLEPSRTRYSKFFKHLYSEDRALYDLLDEKEKPIKLKFGRRLTKKIIEVKRDEIIKDPNKFTGRINMEAVIRKLGKDSVMLFRNSLPSFDDFYDYSVNFLYYFAYRYHYNLVFKTIPNHYSIRYIDHPKLIDTRLLNLEPDNKKRAELARVMVDHGDDDFIKYLTVDESIPMLKEKINVTSDINRRRTLTSDLIRTCSINKDFEAMLKVIKYFIFRHKNDDINVFREFMDTINDSEFSKNNFNEEMWNCYFELRTIFTLKHEEDMKKIKKVQDNPLLKFLLCESMDDMYTYLYFLHKKGTPIEGLLKYVYYDRIGFPQWGEYDKDFEKLILMYIINDAAGKPLTEDDHFRFNQYLIETINSFNRRYPEDQICFYDFPFLVETFKLALEKKDVTIYFRNQVRKKIFTAERDEEGKEYLKLYWRRFNIFNNRKDFLWFLQYDPQSLAEHLELFLRDMIECNDSFQRRRRRYCSSGRKSTRIPRFLFRSWYMLKKFTHLGFDQQTINFCRFKLDDDEFSKYRSRQVGCLSVVMKPEEFVALADSYKPAERKLDLGKADDVKVFNVQCAIAEKFKYTRTYTALPSLLNYCMGDYFQHARCSLYSLMYKTPEQELSQYLNYLIQKAVSVRKHALYFACELTTVKEVEKMITLLHKTEEVASLQKHLCSATIKYFVKNPQDNLFEMVRNNMFITKEDSESHDLIVEKYNDLPNKYRGRYVQHAWEHFEKIIEIPKDLVSLKERLLRRIDGDEDLVSLDFGLRIIKEHLYPNNTLLKFGQTPQFAFYFFLHRKENDTILKTILDIVETSSNKMSFFHIWYSLIMNHEVDDLSFFKPFVDCYEKYVDGIRDFSDHLKVYFLKTRLQMPRNRIESFTEKVLNFMDDISLKYGHRVVEIFLQELGANLDYFLSENNEFCLHLLQKRPSADIVAFVLDAAVEDESTSWIYNTILREIQNIADDGIQIYLYWKCKDYLSSDTFLQDKMKTKG